MSKWLRRLVGSDQVELEFHGAAGEVTGSMHLLHLPQGAVRAGLRAVPGPPRRRPPTATAGSPSRRATWHGVLLSHAHIDHSGNLPGLVKRRLPRAHLRHARHLRPVPTSCWPTRPTSRRKTPSSGTRSAPARPQDRIEPLYTIEDARRVAPALPRRAVRPARASSPRAARPPSSRPGTSWARRAS